MKCPMPFATGDIPITLHHWEMKMHLTTLIKTDKLEFCLLIHELETQK